MSSVIMTGSDEMGYYQSYYSSYERPIDIPYWVPIVGGILLLAALRIIVGLCMTESQEVSRDESFV